MKQKELERQVSQRTGESTQTIRRLGFSPLLEIVPFEERQQPLMIDWDALDQFRNERRRRLI